MSAARPDRRARAHRADVPLGGGRERETAGMLICVKRVRLKPFTRCPRAAAQHATRCPRAAAQQAALRRQAAADRGAHAQAIGALLDGGRAQHSGAGMRVFAATACNRTRLGVAGDERAALGAPPSAAFRWLAASPFERGALAPRHAHGQALVSDQFRFIFVHVPKAGSTTARTMLRPEP